MQATRFKELRIIHSHKQLSSKCVAVKQDHSFRGGHFKNTAASQEGLEMQESVTRAQRPTQTRK